MTNETEDSELADSAASPALPGKKPAKRRVSMSVINFWVDASLLVILVVVGWVSAVLRLVFPLPTGADGWTLWGRTYNEWADFQFACLCALALMVVLHVMLHWNWVCSVLMAQILKSRQKIDDGMQTIYGVGLLIVLLHIILAGVIAAMYGIHKPPG